MPFMKRVNNYIFAVGILFVALFLLPAGVKAAESGDTSYKFTINLEGGTVDDSMMETEFTVPEGAAFKIYNDKSIYEVEGLCQGQKNSI